jgi:hypothetical protein
MVSESSGAVIGCILGFLPAFSYQEMEWSPLAMKASEELLL